MWLVQPKPDSSDSRPLMTIGRAVAAVAGFAGPPGVGNPMSGSSRDLYTVEFRIAGVDLVPDDITQEISLKPWHTRSAGEIRGASGTFQAGLWCFSGVGEDAIRVREWENLEDGLLNLLPHLMDRRQVISSYASRYDVFWWCAHFQGSFDGGPTFSPSVLRALADLEASLSIANYLPSEEE